MPLPRKRLDLEILPLEHEGERYAVMRDPVYGVIEGQLALKLWPGGIVWDLLDGERDAAAVLAFIEAHLPGAKGKLTEEAIEAMAAQLDEALLLDTPRLEARRREVLEEFARAPSRPARFAGNGGYADTADALAQEIDGYYAGQFGAGAPGAPASDGVVRGILAPHIDFHRGGPCYTHAYRRIAEAAPADIYLILAVAHCSPETPFVPTTKAYETPLGAAAVDRDFTEALLKRTSRSGVEHEFVHRGEHSAEFQAVFLRHARRASPDFTVVPILCSAFERWCGDRSPSRAAEVEDYIGALRETIATCGRRVCVVAGVDFAHVGPNFGHDEPAERELIQRMMEGDKQSLGHVATCDAEGFWSSTMADGNWRKVCGLSATYAALRLLEGSRGELLRYTYAPAPASSVVSFAAAAFR